MEKFNKNQMAEETYKIITEGLESNDVAPAIYAYFLYKLLSADKELCEHVGQFLTDDDIPVSKFTDALEEIVGGTSSFFEDYTNGNLGFDVKDIYIEYIMIAQDHFSNVIGKKLTPELDTFISCAVLAIMKAKHEGVSQLEVASWLADDDECWSINDTTEYYKWARETMKWEVSDIGRLVNRINEREIDDEYKSDALDMMKSLAALLPLSINELSETKIEAEYMTQFYNEHKEDCDHMFMSGILIPTMIPKYADIKEHISDKKKCREMLDMFINTIAGSTITDLWESSNKEEYAFMMRCGLCAFLALSDSELGRTFFAQGAAFEL